MSTEEGDSSSDGHGLWLFVALGLLVLANGVTFSPLPLEARLGGAFVLLIALPGWLLVRLVLGRHPAIHDLEQMTLAFGLGFISVMLVGGVLALPGRALAPWQLTVAANIIDVGLLALAWTNHTDLRPRLGRPNWSLVLILGLGSALRLVDLGWSEFQGDEARIVLRAMAVLQGAPDALLAHRKVPGEILATTMFYGQLGAMTELVGRLPFVLAGVAALASFYLLSREIIGPRGALVAGLLLAVDGYAVGFGRVLQYDSVALLLGTLGLLCCLRFSRDEQPDSQLAVLGSTLLFGAGLIALGTIFFIPPAVVLVGPRLLRTSDRRRLLTLLWIWPGILALMAVIGVVTLETITRRSGGVLSYLGPRLAGDAPYWNIDALTTSANHYLSTPYALLMLIGGCLVLLQALAHRLPSRSSRVAGAAIGIGLAVAAASWPRPAYALIIATMCVLVVLLPSRSESLGWKAMLLWAIGPIFVHAFLIRVPGTHWRESFPALALLVAGLIASVPLMSTRPGSRALAAVFGIFILGVAHYSWVSLVQRWPEYQMTFPTYRDALDWTHSSGRGIGGVFGVSHRHGWKALAVLQETGQLSTRYATNESPAIAAWYLRRPQGCPLPLELVVRTPRAPQDRNLSGPVSLPNNYDLLSKVTVAGNETIDLQAPPAHLPAPSVFRAEEWEEQFDRDLTSPWRPVGSLYLPDLGAAIARQSCAAPR